MTHAAAGPREAARGRSPRPPGAPAQSACRPTSTATRWSSLAVLAAVVLLGVGLGPASGAAWATTSGTSGATAGTGGTSATAGQGSTGPAGTPSAGTGSGSTPSAGTGSSSTPSGSTPSGSTPSGSTPSGSTPSGSTAATSYSLVTSSGGVIGFGGALDTTGATANAGAVGAAATADGRGAWIAEADGGVVPLGDATARGSMAGHPLAHPVVGVAGDPTTGGYWLVAADGGIFSFGGAPFFGSTGAMRLNQPIVGMAATPDGMGYWLVAADGGIFSFGDAPFFGSTGAMRLNQPIVGMAATPDGRGYWLVAADGGIFSFGDAPFWGSAAADHQAVVGMVVDRGDGYQNPLRSVSDLRAGRIDQGVDFGGAGPVYALGDGVVTETANSGWPDGAFVCYRLTDGPAAGDYVYVAEDVAPAVTVGQAVTPSTVVGTLLDAPPGMEIGWADPPGVGESLARASGQWSAQDDTSSVPTAFGTNFSQLLASLGAPPGVAAADPTGSLPAGWPTW